MYGSALPPRDPSLVVPIDIRPGSEINPVNPFSNGLIPVAILGKAAFDAGGVDPDTLAFGPDQAAPLHAQGHHLDDINDDGFADLVAHFRTAETGIAFDAIDACLSGETLEGTAFEGCDDVSVKRRKAESTR